MLEIAIPGRKAFRFQHLVLDYNGTLACDGLLLEGVKSRLEKLAEQLTIHVITADTFGSVAREIAGIPCMLTVISQHKQTAEKAAYVEKLGTDSVIAVGNGRNDQMMLEVAALGVVIIQEEGAATAAVLAADIIVPGINAALDLLLKSKRLVATLRC